MILSGYKALATLLGPVIDLYLARRAGRGKESPARIGERRGIASAARPDGAVIWLHAASVGEATGLLPLIETLDRERPDLHLLVTTGTVTSAEAMARRLPAGVLHQFVPVDRPAWVRRFLDHWRPATAVWMESDLWPTLVTETRARGTPIVLVDARLSDGSFARWRRLGGLARPLFRCLDLVLASSSDQAERFLALGCGDVRQVANLKAAAAVPPIDRDAVSELERMIGGRPAWLAANTHPGEDTVVLDAHAILADARPDLLTVIAPRHAARGPEIAALCEDRGLTCAWRSRSETVDDGVGVYIADTMGEMPALYAAIPVTFLAGSLVPVGGHNPVEPAHCGTALLFGPSIPNNRDAADALLAAGAAREVADAGTLAESVATLLADPACRSAMAEAGQEVAAGGRDGLARLLTAIDPYLPDQQGEA